VNSKIILLFYYFTDLLIGYDESKKPYIWPHWMPSIVSLTLLEF
jgi:hypothetical protein